MSSVFGIVKVENSVLTDRTDYPWTIVCDTEGDSGAPKEIHCTKPFPVGTRIYWEYWYHIGKWAFAVI